MAEPPTVQVTQGYETGASTPDYQIPAPDYQQKPPAIKQETTEIKSLLSVDGVRFLFTSFVSNFSGFSVVAVILVAMLGVGVAEEAGLMGALIRKLVKIAPRWAISWIIVPLWLLVGFVIVIAILDIIIPGLLPKWAIFAPVFIPLFIRLGVAPQTLLAAYRLGDSPMNVITPLMVYLPFIVLVAQRYKKTAGLGTIIALMIPYSAVVLVAWLLFFIVWYVLGIPMGPGYPATL